MYLITKKTGNISYIQQLIKKKKCDTINLKKTTTNLNTRIQVKLFFHSSNHLS